MEVVARDLLLRRRLRFSPAFRSSPQFVTPSPFPITLSLYFVKDLFGFEMTSVNDIVQ